MRADDSPDERWMAIGLPDDIVEVALEGEPLVSDAALMRMKRRTLAKVEGEAAAAGKRVPRLSSESVASPESRPPDRFVGRLSSGLSMKRTLVASVLLLTALGAMLRSVRAPELVPPVNNAGVVEAPWGKGGDAIDLGLLTGDAAHDASATLRKFFELLNQRDFDNPRRLVTPLVNLKPEQLEVKGVGRYIFEGGEVVRIEEEFWKTPGDIITMRMTVTVEASAQLASHFFKAGKNVLLVRMIQGGDSRWTVAQFRNEDGKTWPDDSSGFHSP